MAEVIRGDLDAPDEVIEFPKITTSLVELGDLTVGLMVAEPGWRWSKDIRPKVGGEWCQARHVGVMISGRMGIDFSDGTSVEFGRPARALHCAAAIRNAAGRDGLHIRVGVHVGEVELVGDDVRGVAVHEAARITAAAADDEILVSDLTRALAQASGLAFEDRGSRELKGLEGEWRLCAFVG